MQIECAFDHFRRHKRSLKTVGVPVCRSIIIADEHSSAGFDGDFRTGVLIPPIHREVAEVAVAVEAVHRIKPACIHERVKIFFFVRNVVDIKNRNIDAVFLDKVIIEQQMFCIFFHGSGAAGQVIAFASGRTEFIFQLDDNDRTAVGNLARFCDFDQFIVIFFRIFQILRIIGSCFCSEFIHDPLGQTAVAELPVDKGSHAVNAVHSAFCDGVDKRRQIAVTLKIEDSRSLLMISPDGINCHGIQSGSFHLKHAFFPVFARDAAVRKIASINKNGFPVNFNIIFLNGQIHR